MTSLIREVSQCSLRIQGGRYGCGDKDGRTKTIMAMRFAAGVSSLRVVMMRKSG